MLEALSLMTSDAAERDTSTELTSVVVDPSSSGSLPTITVTGPDGETSSVAADTPADAQYELDGLMEPGSYFAALVRGYDHFGWILRDMASGARRVETGELSLQAFSELERQLIEPYEPRTVLVCEWETLPSTPASQVFHVGGHGSPDPSVVLADTDMVTEDRHGEKLLQVLQTNTAKMRLVLADGLSYAVVKALGSAFPRALEYDFFEQQLSSTATFTRRSPCLHLPKPYANLQWYRSHEDTPDLTPIGWDGGPSRRVGSVMRHIIALQAQSSQMNLNRHPTLRRVATLLEEKLSVCFVEPSGSEDMTPTVVILTDTPTVFAERSTMASIWSALRKVHIQSHHSFYTDVVSAIFDCIREDSLLGILSIQDEIKAIKTRRMQREDLGGLMGPWDSTVSEIQDALFTVRQTMKTGLSMCSVMQSLARPNHPPKMLAFRRGIFAGLDDGGYTDDKSEYFLSVVDRTLSDTKDTLDAVRTTITIYESQQAISLATTMALLTELVFLFIPLSFSTSIFGMDIKEFNGGVPLSTWGIIAGSLVAGMLVIRLYASSETHRRIAQRVSKRISHTRASLSRTYKATGALWWGFKMVFGQVRKLLATRRRERKVAKLQGRR